LTTGQSSHDVYVTGRTVTCLPDASRLVLYDAPGWHPSDFWQGGGFSGSMLVEILVR
jgi:hypothetical protein